MHPQLSLSQCLLFMQTVGGLCLALSSSPHFYTDLLERIVGAWMAEKATKSLLDPAKQGENIKRKQMNYLLEQNLV